MTTPIARTDPLFLDRAGSRGDDRLTLHGTSVAAFGRGVLILGKPGAGKSELALQLIALGAGLIADDQTELAARDGALLASCPGPIAGMIEMRGFGLIRAEPVGPAPISCCIDLDRIEKDRLPPPRDANCLGVRLQLFHKVESRAFAAAIHACLRYGMARI